MILVVGDVPSQLGSIDFSPTYSRCWIKPASYKTFKFEFISVLDFLIVCPFNCNYSQIWRMTILEGSGR